MKRMFAAGRYPEDLPGHAYDHRWAPEDEESPCRTCSGRYSREACGSDPRCPSEEEDDAND